MTQLIEKQATAFIKGLEEIVPREALAMLSEKEIALHFAGTPFVDISDLRENTTYSGFSESSNLVIWLWEILTEFDEINKANFLFFLTGSFKVPYGGFKNNPMKIERTYSSSNNLPVAHTCFN